MIKYFDDTTENVLSRLEETQKHFWNIARVTGEFLYTLIKAEGAKNVLEIGTSNGYSGIWLAKAVKENGGHLTTIEFYDKRLDVAKANFKTCKVDDVITTLKGSALMHLEYLPEDFTVGQLRAEYKKQAFLDDIFYPYVAGEENKIVVVLADADDRPYVCVEFQRKESVGHRC